MSRTEVIILNSSSPIVPLSDVIVTPPPPSKERIVPSTSSPDSLPSPLAVLGFNLDKRLKSGSHASRILEGTRLGFTSVSGLVKQGDLNAGEEGKEKAVHNEPKSIRGASMERKAENTSPHFGKLKKPAKSLEPKRSPEKRDLSWELEDGGNPEDANASSTTQVKKSTKKATTNAEGVKAKKTTVKSKPKKECTSTGSNDQPKSGNQNETGKVIVPKPKERRRSTGKSSKHFAEKTTSNDANTPQSPAKQNKHPTREAVAIDPVDLMPPPKRRLSWTPPRDTAQIPVQQESPDVDLQQASLSPSSLKLDFSGLLQNFVNRNAQEAKRAASVAAPEKQSLKRKRIELIEVSTSAHTTAHSDFTAEPRNGVSKKKAKLTSITAIATERFRTTEEHALVEDSKVSKFFAPRKEASKSLSTSPAKAGAQESKAKRPRKRAKSTGEESASRSKKTNAKKPTFKEPPLLKPEQAVQHLTRHEEKHDFVFGTSSQFHREKSPTMLRAIQQSLREADARDSSGFIDIESIESRTVQTKAGLWAAASKVDDGLILAELHAKQTRREEPQAEQDQDSSLAILSQNPMTTEGLPQEDEEVFSWGQAPPKHISTEDHAATAPESRPFGAETSVTTTQSFSAFPYKRSISPAPRPIVPASSPGRVALRSLSTNASPQKRSRGQPQNTKALNNAAQPAVTEVNASAQSVSKRPRGRPRKDNISKVTEYAPLENHESSFKNISEIEDSEAESTPTPPRRRQKKKAASSQLDLASSQEIANSSEKNGDGNGNGNGNGLNRLKTKHPKWAEISEELFPRITEVVKGMSRGEVGKPSWWEKMLMYDPIVIEDLTAWLEEQGVRVPGYNEGASEGGKVKGWMVQKWCEDKSVCCLWREGLRGGVKYQY